MKRLVLLVGIPGSGKTTLAKKLVDQGYLLLCADTIRKELFGNEAEQKEPEKVFAIFFAQLEAAMSEGKDIVIDNTNINMRHRNPILERAKQAGYTDIELWLLDVPLDLCLTRNKQRQRNVPEDIVRNMHKAVTGHGKPQTHEGKIIIVRPSQTPFEFEFFPTDAGK